MVVPGPFISAPLFTTIDGPEGTPQTTALKPESSRSVPGPLLIVNVPGTVGCIVAPFSTTVWSIVRLLLIVI